jgi:predicted lysophospholipase L1 biosynthesis ABC-type transport system permease subunit
MKRLRLLGLGAKLATAGGRPSWIRLTLMAVGFMVGSALLLSAASIVPALHALDVRRDSIYGIEVGPRAHNALRVWGIPQSFGDLDVRTSVVEPIGKAPVPPGLSRVPGPGEIFASGRLAEMWSSIGPAMEQRLQGRLAGTIGREGVVGPDDLAIWMGKPNGVRLRSAGAYVQRSFGGIGRAGEPLDLGALLLLVAITSAILIPIWFFVATATRLSAATREARLAAVRLAGATEGQVRFLAAAEAGVAASMGSWLGVPLFLAIRPFLASGPIGGIHVFPSDLTPPPGLAIALLILLPTLAIVMSLGTMRRLVVSPLGVTRQARRSHAGWRWIVVLVAGVAVLAWSASQHSDLKRFGGVMTALLVGGSLVFVGFGLVGTATWSAWAMARRLAGSIRSVPGMLGLRRLEAEPTSVSRVVGGVALLITLVGVVQSGLISIERSEGGPYLPVFAQLLTGNDVGVWEGNIDPASVADLTSIPGVRSVRWTHKVPFGRVGMPIGIVATDGAPATLEAIRGRLAWSGASIHTLPQLRESAMATSDDYASYRRAAMAITLFLLLVSAATLLVAMVDWLMERRRSLAVLSAVGVSTSTVRRSILVQVALPLATSATFGVGGAVVVTALLYSAVEQPVVLATRQIVTLVCAVVLVVLAVTACSAPWLRISRRSELLREA